MKTKTEYKNEIAALRTELDIQNEKIKKYHPAYVAYENAIMQANDVKAEIRRKQKALFLLEGKVTKCPIRRKKDNEAYKDVSDEQIKHLLMQVLPPAEAEALFKKIEVYNENKT